MTETLLSSSPVTSPSPGDGFDLLCACAAPNPGREQIARITNWNWAEFDSDGFLRLAAHHGVLALAARNLTQHARVLPTVFRQALESAYDANLRRSLWFAAELARIVEHFAYKQLLAVPYKGPALAQSAYGDLGSRSFSDLDLLISPEDFEPAKQALSEIGYRPSLEVAPAVERLWRRTGYERSFDGVAGKNLVELQWRLVPYFYAMDRRSANFQIEDLLLRAGRIHLCGVEVPCLSPEDSLLVLCLHAAKHLWMRLIWVADIAVSLCVPGIDFAVVAERARALGIARMMGIGFRLTERLLGATVPAAARVLIARNPEEARLSEESVERLRRAAAYDFESVEYFRKMFRLRERMGDRCRYLWRLTWTPGPGEVATIELPEALFLLYRIVRIGRLLRKLV